MNFAPSPEIVQNNVLATLNGQDQRWRAYANTFPTGYGVPSGAMGQWLNGLPAVVWPIEQLRPLAGWLWQQGYPAALQQLNTRLQEIYKARDVYISMYNNQVQHEANLAGIMRGAVAFNTNQIMAATNRQNVVFQNWLTDMFDINENRCRDCHNGIGIPGGGYCYACAKRRGWVW
jgi:hypothetical protein